jgi:hypothetical protein
MSCIIKIREEDGYKIFDSEEAVMEYIRDNNATIGTMKDEHGNDVPYLKKSTRTGAVAEAIYDAHRRSFEQTRETIVRQNINEWDTEEFNRQSPIASLSLALKSLKVTEDGEEKRLFPEFVTNNYLNTLIQNSICAQYLSDIGLNNSRAAVDGLRRRVFENTIGGNDANAGLKSASY